MIPFICHISSCLLQFECKGGLISCFIKRKEIQHIYNSIFCICSFLQMRYWLAVYHLSLCQISFSMIIISSIHASILFVIQQFHSKLCSSSTLFFLKKNQDQPHILLILSSLNNTCLQSFFMSDLLQYGNYQFHPCVHPICHSTISL